MQDVQNKVNEFIDQPLAQKVLFFNEMLTPDLIRLGYWLTLVAVVWNGLGMMFSGGFASFIEGIVFIVIASIMARVAAELVILFFKLNENMAKVVENTEAAAPAAASVAPAAAPKKKVTRKAAKKVSKKKT